MGRIKKEIRLELQEQLVRRMDCFVLIFQAKLEKNRDQPATGGKVIGRFKSLFTYWTRGLRRRLAGNRYHPEEHYMRGPGPKTRAKYSDHKSRS
ncbi:MAG: hypothetical protein E5X86_15720 [Mesorhizobium sp.]|nr:MAG: hypothetical protein EOQ87_21975 [Mesorhizobium sp.]RWH95052.1 MAG: hypothetical protein EOQ88_24255 [Mesorhizobium sp.]RWM77817.1 MAG: hypothetical protein EOR83_32890 [Mesorhizobium sp.]TIO16477.1 MAG: hypothetical protein E5X86_15720 [Mesorhizobium sp.]TIO39987.1 MAG: hypothetical protein E5X81_33435 [Mesorhizobium sp.]